MKKCEIAWLLAAAFVCFAGCGKDEPTGPAIPASIVGTYTLATIDGKSMPAVVSENPQTGYREEVTGGSVELKADGTCTWRTDYRYTEADPQIGTHTESSSGSGTYTVEGEKITFTFGSDQLMGTIVEDALTVYADGVLVYRRT